MYTNKCYFTVYIFINSNTFCCSLCLDAYIIYLKLIITSPLNVIFLIWENQERTS